MGALLGKMVQRNELLLEKMEQQNEQLRLLVQQQSGWVDDVGQNSRQKETDHAISIELRRDGDGRAKGRNTNWTNRPPGCRGDSKYCHHRCWRRSGPIWYAEMVMDGRRVTMEAEVTDQLSAEVAVGAATNAVGEGTD